PFPEPLALAVGEARKGDPVCEGQPASADEHAMAYSQDRGLVRDVQQRLLTQARVEGAFGEGKRGRVSADDRHPGLLDQPVEPGGARRAARVELERDDGRAPTARQEAGGPAESRAHVQDAARRADAGPPREAV